MFFGPLLQGGAQEQSSTGAPQYPPIAGLPLLGNLGASAAASGAQTITQATRFDNTNLFYSGTLTTVASVVQSTRFDNANQFFSGTVTSLATITQGTRFDNAQVFYSGTVTLLSGPQTVTQATRFDNAQTYYAGTVSSLVTVDQSTRFDNAQVYYTGTITQGFATQPITQNTRFDNVNAFYAGSISQTAGVLQVVQDARFDNVNQFYGGTVTGGAEPELIGGHYGEWWAAKYRKMFDKPTVAEVVEYVIEEPAQAVAIVKELAPQSIPENTVWQDVKANKQLQQVIAQQIIIAAKMRKLTIERDEDDIETMLLLG